MTFPFLVLNNKVEMFFLLLLTKSLLSSFGDKPIFYIPEAVADIKYVNFLKFYF